MGWVKKEAIPHGCTVPRPSDCEGIGAGSIWQCDECGTRWETVSNDGWNWRSVGKPKPLKVDPVEYDYAEKDPLPWWRRF